jgi:hypothetical protein
MLIGDIIIGARELFNDPPQVLPPPVLNFLGTVGGGSLPPGTYYVVATQTNAWGESAPCAEQSVVVAAGQGIDGQFNFSPNGTGFNLYVGTAPGQENVFMSFTSGLGFSFSNLNGFAAGAPPPTSSAYLPDTDGNYVKAAAIFRWLTDGLRQGSRLAGGLPDYSGFPSIQGFPTYQVPGEWVKLTNAWYDGYPVSFDNTTSFFKRNQVVSSVLGSWALSYYNGQLGVEMWPQPARTATQTTISAPMGATDIGVQVTSTAGFLLPTYGMVQFGPSGNSPAIEICGYNGLQGGIINGLTRALGGTFAQAWPANTPVNELNCFFQGRRVYSNPLTPGSSASPLYIPAGWDGTLITFLLSKYYETEKDGQMQQAKFKEFKDDIQGWLRTNRQLIGPRQAGSRDYQFIVFGGTRFGGNIIP